MQRLSRIQRRVTRNAAIRRSRFVFVLKISNGYGTPLRPMIEERDEMQCTPAATMHPTF